MSTYVNKIEPIGVETGETKKKNAPQKSICAKRVQSFDCVDVHRVGRCDSDPPRTANTATQLGSVHLRSARPECFQGGLGPHRRTEEQLKY